ncbi:MAG: pyridoxal 5'-phosphate synthase glutaminase subunit PdxT [Planctomycetes bacterium]|nr:pyridoxal 5'-phosphate synthase glutaminase subunit PdxT [Planctomycetota bacterium]
MTPTIGVLALQGDFAAHATALEAAGARGVECRTAAEVARVDGLVIPGGESTTLLRLLAGSGIEQAVRDLLGRGGAVFGTCAGAILLAREVAAPAQSSWGLLDIAVERNAYGRQVESFEGAVPGGRFGPEPLPVVFIRAPRIRRVGTDVETLLALEGEPILVRQGRVLAGTFHPELAADRRVHRAFVELTARKGAAAEARRP